MRNQLFIIIPILSFIIQQAKAVDEYLCLPCHTDCQSCSGPSYKECITCANSGLNPVNQLCSCNSRCSTCENNSCTNCNIGYLLVNNLCLKKCLDGQYEVYQTGECVSCTQQNCKVCDEKSCTQCLDNYIKNSLGLCIEESLTCQPDEYFDQVLKDCVKKPAHCLVVDSTGKCSLCENNYTLLQIQGIMSCIIKPDHCLLLDQQGLCTKCDVGFEIIKVGQEIQCKAEEYYFLCMECPQNCTECTDGVTCSVCDTGYQLNSSHQCVKNTISTCDKSCKLCINVGSNECYECNDKYTKGDANANGTFQCKLVCDLSCTTCISNQEADCLSCPTGKVLIKTNLITNSGKCLNCPLNCDQCQQNRMCIKCQAGFKISIYNGSCIPENEKDQNFLCKPDLLKCKNCLSDTVCVQCEDGFEVDLITSLCVTKKSNCPKSTYFDGVSKCLPCSFGCSECNGPELKDCNSCLNGSNLYTQCQPISCLNDKNFIVIGQSDCQPSCPQGTFANQVTRICEKCDIGQYLDKATQQCKPCNTNCDICADNGVCLRCKNGFEGSLCTECSGNKFVNSSNQCVFCNLNCSSCSGSSNNCTACLGTGRQISNNNCSCEASKFDNFKDNKQKDCTSKLCISGFYDEKNDSCVENICNPNCVSCTSPAEDACIICNQEKGTKFNWLGQCLNSCPNGTKPDFKDANNFRCIIYTIPEPINCQSNQYYDGSSCKPCISNCKSCINGSTCQTCLAGYFYQNGSCQQCQNNDPNCQNVNQCPDTQFYDGVKCSQCITGCSKCANSSFCQTCQSGYYLKENICQKCLANDPNCQSGSCIGLNRDKNNSCLCQLGYKDITAQGIKLNDCFPIISACQKGQYKDDQGICQNCNQKCKECYSSNDNNCLSCQQDLFYNNGSCVNTCPSQTYPDILKYLCIDCKIDPSKCLTCSSNQYYDLTLQSCQNCPSKCIGCSNSSQCIKCTDLGRTEPSCECSPGKYSDSNGVCQTCNSNCSICSNITNCSQCKGNNRDPLNTCNCKNGFTDVSGTIKLQDCISINSSCQSNQYLDNTNKCQACDSSCLSCYGSGRDKCTKCNSNEFYFMGTCNGNCPDNYVGDQATGQCIECKQASCMKCQSGYYLDNLKCLPCNLNCATCNNSTSCLNCQEGKTGNDCSQCIAGTYKDQNGICLKCDLKCAECSDKATTCTKCQGNNRDINKLCVCNDGYVDIINGVQLNDCIVKPEYSCNEANQYYDNGSCQSCHSSCYSCYGSSDSNCLMCLQGSFLYRGKCLSQCPGSTYFDESKVACIDCTVSSQCLSQCLLDEFYDIQSRTCMKCPKKCSGCVNATTCKACAPGRIGQNCDSCEIGYYLDINNNCSKCDSKCYSCESSVSKCIFCKGANRKSPSNNCSCLDGYTDVNGSIILEDCILQNNSSTQCQTSQYFKDNKCLSCHQSCLTCFGPTLAQCTSCPAGFIYFKGGCTASCPKGTTLDTVKNTCIECISGDCIKQSCQQGQYFDYNNQTCSPCKVECATCESSQICSTCAAGRAGYNCSGCEKGKYLDQFAVCRNCDPKCAACQISASNCTECSDGTKRKDLINKCDCQDKYIDTLAGGIRVKNCFSEIDGCLDGLYKNDTGDCLKCSPTCKTCSGGSDSECRSCEENFYFLNGRCVQECVFPFLKDEIGKKCVECLDPTQCAQKCSTGEYYDLKQRGCFNCPKSCISCTSSNSCSSCKENRYGDQCQFCKDGSFANMKGECQLCSLKCSTCSSELQCLTCRGDNRNPLTCECLDGYTDLINNLPTINCVKITQQSKCASGQYVGNNRCNKCNESCKECSGGTSKDCTACKIGKFYLNGQCVEECPSNMKYDQNTFKCVECSNNDCLACGEEQYYNFISQKCLPCDQKCGTCKGPGDACSKCSILRKEPTCDQCLDGFYQDQFGQCNQCEIKCSTCKNSSGNCLNCNGYNRNPLTCECEQGYIDTFSPLGDVYQYKNCFKKPSKKCSPGQFEDITSQCKSCDPECDQCYGATSTECLTCKSQYFFLNGKCVSDCNTIPGYTLDENTQNSCRKLLPNESIIPKKCEDGYFYDKQLRGCYKCHEKCKTCTNTGSQCETCSNDRIDDGQNCSTCINGFYQNTQGLCQQCDVQCSKCKDNASQCTQCQGKNRKTIKEGCICLDSYTDNLGKKQMIDCIQPDKEPRPQPIITLDESTTKLGGSHYKFTGKISFSKSVNIFDFQKWSINIGSLDAKQFKFSITYPESVNKLADVSNHIFLLEVEIYSEIKNENLPSMELNIPNQDEIQDIMQQELNSNKVLSTIPKIKEIIITPITPKEENKHQNREPLINPIIQPVILLALCLPSKFYAFALSMDILQMINQAQFFNLNYEGFLNDALTASDFSNFRFFPKFKKDTTEVPLMFKYHEIDSNFIFNVIQPLSIWLFSFILYILCSLVRCKHNNFIFRMIKSYKNNYFYFILSGVALITFTRSLESTFLQLRDFSSLEETLPLISYILSILSTIYYLGYLYLSYQAVQYQSIQIFDNDKLFKKYSFFTSGIKNFNKCYLFYFIVALRKILYTSAVVFFFDDPVKQVGFCNFIIGMETLLLMNIQPFQKPLEQKLHVISRILLLGMLSLMYILAFENEAQLFKGESTIIINYLTLAVTLGIYLIQIVYNYFIQVKNIRQSKLSL